MARPALTVALVLASPALAEACRPWLPANRYESVVLTVDPGETLAAVLGPRQDDFDAVVLEQSLLVTEAKEQMLAAGLLFPAVIVGDCLLYTSPSPRDQRGSRLPSSG
mgnify:CR=1 FL=1